MSTPQLTLHEFGAPGGRRGLWLHGWLGSGAEGEALARALGPGFQLICPDLPGHGGPPMAAWDLSRTLAAVAEMAADCDFAAGYSMGGRILMMAAARHPESFRRLVIESASPGDADPQARARRRQADCQRGERLCKLGLPAFLREWEQMEMWGGFRDFPPRQGDEAQLAGALNLFSRGNQPDLRPWLRTTTCRLLWLAGRRDAAYVEHADWVRAHTRHRVEVLDTGHNLHSHDPEGWADRVRSFLQTANPAADQ